MMPNVARMDAMLSRFPSKYAMTNREEIDGFIAALICSPDIAKPSEYLPEIWGEEMCYDEAFVDREQLLHFLGLLMRRWNSIVCILHEEDVFAPLLFHGEGGIVSRQRLGTRVHASTHTCCAAVSGALAKRANSYLAQELDKRKTARQESTR